MKISTSLFFITKRQKIPNLLWSLFFIIGLYAIPELKAQTGNNKIDIQISHRGQEYKFTSDKATCEYIGTQKIIKINTPLNSFYTLINNDGTSVLEKLFSTDPDAIFSVLLHLPYNMTNMADLHEQKLKLDTDILFGNNKMKTNASLEGLYDRNYLYLDTEIVLPESNFKTPSFINYKIAEMKIFIEGLRVYEVAQK